MATQSPTLTRSAVAAQRAEILARFADPAQRRAEIIERFADHDVSGEARASDGKWTAGGGPATKAKKGRKEKPAKKDEQPVAKVASAKEKPPRKRKVASKSVKPPPEPAPSAKAARAKASAVRVDKVIQRYAEEHNEPRFAKVVGGQSLPDSEAYDIDTEKHAIELKTLVINGNGKLTMDKYAQVRKIVHEQESGQTFHTVVSDDQGVFNAKGEGQHDESKRKYYYRRGVAGSARIGALYACKDEAELKHLMSLPESELPEGARRTDGKYREGTWQFVPTGKRGAGYYRNLDTGEEAHSK